MAKLDPKNEHTWPVSIKLLAFWRLCGRAGLTVHAIATLTGRDAKDVLNELADHPYVWGTKCSDVMAMVWKVHLTRDSTRAYMLVEPGALLTPRASSRRGAEAELAQWPHPQYTCIHNGKAYTEGVVIGNALLERVLCRMGRGLYFNLQAGVDDYTKERGLSVV